MGLFDWRVLLAIGGVIGRVLALLWTLAYGFHFDQQLAGAILILVAGGSMWFAPHWYYDKVSPDQVTRDRKRFVAIGAIMLVFGVALLGMWVLDQTGL